MKRGYITKLAALTGYQNSTVSRVLNRRAGVDSAVREAVLQAAASMGLPQPEPSDAALILPAIPTYFWGALESAAVRALEAEGIVPRVSIYTKLADTETQLRYLDDAEACGAKVILAALGEDRRIAERVTELAGKTKVFLLCQDLDCPGTFYFGSDYTTEGIRMGEACAKRLEGKSPLLVVGGKSRRIDGICRSYPGEVRLLEYQSHGAASAAAKLARLLVQQPAPAGIVSLGGETATLCLAVEKCRMNVLCFGFEYAPADVGYVRSGRLAAIVCQDLAKIAEVSAKAAGNVVRGEGEPAERTILKPLCWP